jgi:hypothetical protein
MTALRCAVIHAKDATPVGISAAFARQGASARPGPHGPIGPLPMIIIPMAAGARPSIRPTHQKAPVTNTTLRSLTERLARHREGAPLLVAAGLATPYHVPIVRGGRYERLAPGAFAQSLTNVVARVGHGESAPVVGSTADGTLRLFDGESGLRFQLDLTSPAARSEGLASRVEAGCFVGTSVGYYVERAAPVGPNAFAILQATLFEVSLVHYTRVPKHRGTEVSLESACTNCRRLDLESYVHMAADRVIRCRGCGMRYVV